MLIRLGYDLEFYIPSAVTIVAMLHVHPSRTADLREPDELRTEPPLQIHQYADSFDNLCSRFHAPAGRLRLWNSTLIEDSGEPDPVNTAALEVPVEELPTETIQFLLSTRYCQVDQLSNTALDLFGSTTPGWARVQAICDWVNQKVIFGYNYARSNKTALDVYTDRTGVCRDYQHLAITFCRALNIPARYATGYLGDIGVIATSAMDFSAWFEVYLEDRWWAFDARNNQRRIGRVLMARGRDAADVALTTSFGIANLTKFEVTTDEVILEAR